MNENATIALAEWRIKAKQEGIKKEYKHPIQKLLDNPKSRSQAMETMCCQCVGGESNWRSIVRACTSYGCALFTFRAGYDESQHDKYEEAMISRIPLSEL